MSQTRWARPTGPRQMIWTVRIKVRLPSLVTVSVCRVLMDPAITGEAHRAKANAGGGWVLVQATQGGHAALYRLLLDPAVTGEEHNISRPLYPMLVSAVALALCEAHHPLGVMCNMCNFRIFSCLK